jgi:hypothetical protein
MSRHTEDSRTDAERLAEEFDRQLAESEQRAADKRETHTYPYDLEESA